MSIFLTCIDVNTQHLAAAAAAESVLSNKQQTSVLEETIQISITLQHNYMN